METGCQLQVLLAMRLPSVLRAVYSVFREQGVVSVPGWGARDQHGGLMEANADNAGQRMSPHGLELRSGPSRERHTATL